MKASTGINGSVSGSKIANCRHYKPKPLIKCKDLWRRRLVIMAYPGTNPLSAGKGPVAIPQRQSKAKRPLRHTHTMAANTHVRELATLHCHAERDQARPLHLIALLYHALIIAVG